MLFVFFLFKPDAPYAQSACDDLVNVSLLENCSFPLTPDMVLEGVSANQIDNYAITVFYSDGSASENAVDRPGRFIYEVTGPQDFKCRGEVKAEDKGAPAYVCSPKVIDYVHRSYAVQKAQGRLSERKKGQINFSAYSCFQDENGAPGNCAQAYDLLEFYVSETDVYTFEVWDPEHDPNEIDNELHIALFQGDFKPQEPCANILAQSNVAAEYGIVNHNDDPAGRFRIALALIPDKKYTLLIAQDDCNGDRGDLWTAYAFSDQDGKILDGSEVELEDRFGDPDFLDVKKRLYCSDLDYILNSAEYTDNPLATDNCDAEPETWFEDALIENSDCGDIRIVRTWRIQDASGNKGESCRQTIEFKRPDLSDVQKPPTTVAIECDEIQAAWLDENGALKPEVGGFPFVIAAFGIADLQESFCNVGADFQDISRIDVCPSTDHIVRQWTILDWCQIEGQWALNNGTEVNWRQVVKIGDFSAPELTTEGDITINSGPFACGGVLVIPEIEVSDNCSDFDVHAVVYKATEETEVDSYGRPTGQVILQEEKYYEGKPNDLVPAIIVGETYHLYYQVEDVCGNAATSDAIKVTAQDKINPVAACVGDLTVSIGGEGFGRLHIRDVDEGSWDNCGSLELFLSRKLADESIRDAYLTQIYDGLVFAELEKSAQLDPSGQDAEVWVSVSESEIETPVLRFKNGMWYSWWEENVFFLCEDINESSALELMAIDPMGNANVCWLEATTEDKIAPYCIAPADVRMDCTDLPYGFDPNDVRQLESLFGEATANDNCSGATVADVHLVLDWNCNSGSITRSFQAEDAGGLKSTNACSQTIVVDPIHNYEIKFPADAETECGVLSPDTVMLTENACDLLTVNLYDERFDVTEGDACYKIRRTYRVLNWCEYDGEADPVLIGRNEDCDGEEGENDVYVLRRPEIIYIDEDDDETAKPSMSSCGNGAEGHLTNSELENRLQSVGFWEYTQYLKVYDQTAPVISLSDPDPFCADNVFVRCSGDIRIPFSISEECETSGLKIEVWLDEDNDGTMDFEVTTAVLSGNYPNFLISGNYPIGQFTFEVRVADACMNGSVKRTSFEVVDCKAPTPVCISGLAVELTPQEPGTDADGDGDEDLGAMSVWATDFKVSLDQDCSPGFTYSINRMGETPDIDRQNLILTCDDPDTVMVEIYIWDSADNPYAVQPDGSIGGRNYDHCLTYIVVQDNMFNLCTPGPSLDIAGYIATEIEERVENVEVRLSGPINEVQYTSVAGEFHFTNLESDADYTLRPWKNNEQLNGVSTFDLVLLTRHLLGIRRLSSPYLLIAADVNRSRTINTLDLIRLRKLVLSVDTEFRNNTSWRFVPKDYKFPSPENPWVENFPEVISVNDLSIPQLETDFVAIKIGDLNGSAKPNNLFISERNIAGRFTIELEDRQLKTGEEYRVHFTTRNANVQGYQFTLNFDRQALELIDLEEGLAKEENFGMRFVEEGVLTTSWNGKAEDSFHLFTLVFRAKQNARLRDLIRLNSQYTRAEAYGAADELLDVDLQFQSPDNKNLQDSCYLDQNTPNPFVSQTLIGFYLPQSTEISLKISDFNGRTLKLIRDEYAKGYHQISLNSDDFLAPGVFYYTLETEFFTETKKMIALGE